MKVRVLAAIGAVALFMAFQSNAFADAVLDRARLLIQTKKPKAAYELLLPLEAQRAGDFEFDYLLGIAALDSGDPQRAIFALERALTVNPQHQQARAEIARAYFELGERENARREFENVRASNPPEAVKQTIDRFLSALGVGPRRLSGFIEIGYGMDSNVNSATPSGQVAIPAFGGPVTLAPGSSRIGDNFTAVNLGGSLVEPLTPEWALVGGLAAGIKLNDQATQFDTTTYDGNVGARWSRGKEAVTVGYQLQNFLVDNTRFRDTNGIVAQWQHSYSDARQITAYTQLSELRYPSQTIRNARREVYGLAYAENIGGSLSPVVFGGGYFGQEKEHAEGVPQLGNKFVGIRLGGQITVAPRQVIFASASYEQRHYGGEEPLFFVPRNDGQTDLRIGMNYPISQDWSLVPQVSYTGNRSNIVINDYNRTVAMIMLRREF